MIMEHYAVIQNINGACVVKFEGDDPQAMEVNYYQWVAALLNDKGEVKGVVKLVDGNLDVYDGCIKFINKPAKEA
jgi:hypothetical protein